MNYTLTPHTPTPPATIQFYPFPLPTCLPAPGGEVGDGMGSPSLPTFPGGGEWHSVGQVGDSPSNSPPDNLPQFYLPATQVSGEATGSLVNIALPALVLCLTCHLHTESCLPLPHTLPALAWEPACPTHHTSLLPAPLPHLPEPLPCLASSPGSTFG